MKNFEFLEWKADLFSTYWHIVTETFFSCNLLTNMYVSTKRTRMEDYYPFQIPVPAPFFYCRRRKNKEPEARKWETNHVFVFTSLNTHTPCHLIFIIHLDSSLVSLNIVRFNTEWIWSGLLKYIIRSCIQYLYIMSFIRIQYRVESRQCIIRSAEWRYGIYS